MVAGMHNSNDLEFISIADITSDIDVGTMTTIQEANIIVNVFHLLQSQKELARPEDSLKKGSEVEHGGKDSDDEVPQGKVILLPSKDLHGVWNSYAITLLPPIMS